MGKSDRSNSFALDSDGIPAALCCGRCATADTQSLHWEHQRRAAGRDEPYAHRVAGSHGRVEPLAGAALTRPEGVAACLVCVASLLDSGRAGTAELSGVVGFP